MYARTAHDARVTHRTGRTLLVAVILAAADVASAQATPAVNVVVRGVVRDTLERPVQAATVAQLGTMRITTTDREGRFELVVERVAGRRAPRITVRHEAHEPVVLTIADDTSSGPVALTITLLPLAAPIPRVVVRAAPDRPMSTASTRQEITRLPPMVEPDAIRALTFLPSVQQPNGLIGRVHVAGAALDEALYTLDGHPLQSPNHVRGIGSGVLTAALDHVEVLSHHVPATVESRAGGVIAMHTRRGDGADGGEALVSSLSVSGAVTERFARGADLLLAGRVTYLRRMMDGFDPDWFGDQFPINDYQDGIVRVGGELGFGWRAELLGFASTDLASFERERVPGRPWRGEYLAGLTLSRTVGRRTQRIRWSRDVLTRAEGDFADTSFDANALRSRQVLGSVSLEDELQVSGRTRLATRVGLTQARYAHRWDAWNEVAPGAPRGYDGTQTLFLGTAAMQATRSLSPTVTGDAGFVVDANWRGAYVAPRVHLGWRASPVLSFDASLERRHQFDGEYSPELESDKQSPLFRFARPRRQDGVALSARWTREWSTYALVVRGDLYARRTKDRPVGAEEFAWDDTTARTALAFDRVDARSFGTGIAVALSGPRGAGAQLTYALARTEQRDSLGWYRAAWDRPQVLSVLVTSPRVWGITVTATGRAQSGVPVAPLLGTLPYPSPFHPDDHFLLDKPLLGRRGSASLPATARLDLALRREWRTRRLQGDVQLQLINVSGAQTPYAAYWLGYGASDELFTRSEGIRIPSIGVSFRW